MELKLTSFVQKIGKASIAVYILLGNPVPHSCLSFSIHGEYFLVAIVDETNSSAITVWIFSKIVQGEHRAKIEFDFFLGSPP